MPEWIADNLSLKQAVASWRAEIALDTEFIRTDTYYPLPGLYQVASQEDFFLIDPLAIDDWQPFAEYLERGDRVKVMHACLEDLELIYHHLNVRPKGIFDTQFAHAFVSADYSLSYTGLVKSRLNQVLDQHETRSNWLRRPLSQTQLDYAVEDVTYLVPMYRQLSRALDHSERLGWFQEDMARRGDYQSTDPHECYRTIKKASLLRGQSLAVLKSLAAWREKTARRENIPRNRVIWEEHLLEFAKTEVLDVSQIQQVLPRGVARRYGEDLLLQHELGRRAAEPPDLPRPLSSAQSALLKKLKVSARFHAQRLQLAPELLSRKKELEACIRYFSEHNKLPPLYDGWRSEILGSDFLDILRGGNGSHG